MELNKIAQTLDALLQKADLSKVTSDGPGFQDLPDGYYLCEVHDDTKLTETKETADPMVSYRFTVVEDGYQLVENENGEVSYARVKAKGRNLFINYVLNDIDRLNRFVSDMLKFEDPAKPGEPLLPKEMFMSTETLLDAIDCTKTSRIWINVSTYTGKDGQTRTRNNLVKWDRIPALGLPTD